MLELARALAIALDFVVLARTRNRASFAAPASAWVIGINELELFSSAPIAVDRLAVRPR